MGCTSSCPMRMSPQCTCTAAVNHLTSILCCTLCLYVQSIMSAMCHGLADNCSEGSSGEQDVGQDGMPGSSTANAIDSNQTTASSSVGRPLQVGAGGSGTAVDAAALLKLFCLSACALKLLGYTGATAGKHLCLCAVCACPMPTTPPPSPQGCLIAVLLHLDVLLCAAGQPRSSSKHQAVDAAGRAAGKGHSRCSRVQGRL